MKKESLMKIEEILKNDGILAGVFLFGDENHEWDVLTLNINNEDSLALLKKTVEEMQLQDPLKEEIL